jgi:hypothetical protein
VVPSLSHLSQQAEKAEEFAVLDRVAASAAHVEAALWLDYVVNNVEHHSDS